MTGLLFVVSAASGTGKTTLVKALVERVNNLHVSVSHTTRPIRTGEIDQVHYHFIDRTSFEQLIDQQGFIEYAEVFGHYYGTTRATVEQQLEQGHDVLLEIDWQGAQQVRHLFPKAKQIFILPPSQYDLRQRLSNRGTDSVEVIETRLSQAITDMQQYDQFDYVVLNDHFETALSQIEAIISASRLTVLQQKHRHHQLLTELTTAPQDQTNKA